MRLLLVEPPASTNDTAAEVLRRSTFDVLRSALDRGDLGGAVFTAEVPLPDGHPAQNGLPADWHHHRRVDALIRATKGYDVVHGFADWALLPLASHGQATVVHSVFPLAGFDHDFALEQFPRRVISVLPEGMNVGGVGVYGRLAPRPEVNAEAVLHFYQTIYKDVVVRDRKEEHRPWGYYEVLSDEPNHKVKRLVVLPSKRLSLQRHQHRAEHWNIISGEALVTIDRKEYHLTVGQSVNIPRGAIHRIQNPGTENLVIIEIQTGDYFGEDDIERFEDDFGRA